MAAKRSDDRQAHAHERATALAPKLDRLTVLVPVASRVPGLEVLRDGLPVAAALWGNAAVIDAGKHQIEARAAATSLGAAKSRSRAKPARPPSPCPSSRSIRWLAIKPCASRTRPILNASRPSRWAAWASWAWASAASSASARSRRSATPSRVATTTATALRAAKICAIARRPRRSSRPSRPAPASPRSQPPRCSGSPPPVPDEWLPSSPRARRLVPHAPAGPLGHRPRADLLNALDSSAQGWPASLGS